MYDAPGPLFARPDLADLYPKEGQPAEDPAILALVTIFQFVEGVSDRQTADAVRGRSDWEYALCLSPEGEGFDASTLSEFRVRLIAGGAERRLFETLLERLKVHQLVKPRGRQRTDSTRFCWVVLGWAGYATCHVTKGYKIGQRDGTSGIVCRRS